jgi:3'-phosphoadenosine 5'-phosphosulfate sulfotransferase (PAPS reductase)/FAD synthetase
LKHIIFYSGGLGSWATAKRVIAEKGRENVILMFTDTLIEDKDLYRFMIETAAEIFKENALDLVEKTFDIPAVSHETMAQRREFLLELAADVRERIPQFAWIADGRDPWQIYKHKRWIGNSRKAQCSHMLKQDMSAKYLKENFPDPNEITLYLGIDWTEAHRKEKPTENWKPYNVEFPMCDWEPLLDKEDIKELLAGIGIELPELYKLGFSHNNCGGFCCRAGQGHFANLLETKPELYKYHEEKEEEMRKFLQKDNSILKKQIKGVRYNLTLAQLRKMLETGSKDIDMGDIGGCGCMVDDEDGNYFENLQCEIDKKD